MANNNTVEYPGDGNRGLQQGFNYGTINANFGVRDDPLSLLLYAANAPFNASGKDGESYCLPETRVEILECIGTWTNSDDRRHIFWLRGWAGTGKSTIARTVSRNYYDEKRLLVASFFFSTGGGDVSNAKRFVSTIATQLAHKSPVYRDLLQKAISEDPKIVQRVLRDQWRELIIGPLSKIEAGRLPSPLIIVVDALDECGIESDIRQVLQILADTRGLDRVRLRVLITSRPETLIRDVFSQFSVNEYQDLVLHDISEFIVDRDISAFLRHNLSMIRPSDFVIENLVQKASGLFIWAATTCRFVLEGRKKAFSERRLATILDSGGTGKTAPEKYLNMIYITVLRHSISPDYTEEEKETLYGNLKHILGSVVVLLSPLSISSLSRLLDLLKERITETLDDIHAIIDIPVDDNSSFRLHHPSFRDFLLNKERCTDLDFWVDARQAHLNLLTCGLQLMSTALRQNVCGMDSPGMLVVNTERSQVERCIPPEVQYACLYWVQHLQKSETQLWDETFSFLKEHLLHWLEALGWIGHTSEGILALISLETQISASKYPDIYAFVHDAKRFALSNRSVVEQAPLQIYCSALVFAPEKSIVRRQFEKLLQTLEGHTAYINTVVFSPGGSRLASASGDNTVRLWDAATGAQQQTLEGHTGPVRTVVFSPDGSRLASASWDNTVRLWDAATGAQQQTLKGHTSSVRTVVFSPDGSRLASASDDKTVRLWGAATGAQQQTLEGHTRSVRTVVFSPDGSRLASASNDNTVRLWDVAMGVQQQMLDGHTGLVSSVVFSPDGSRLASASDDNTVRLWDAATGTQQQTLEGHTAYINTVVFSPDGSRLASASWDATVRLWDAATGAQLQTLEGHTAYINTVVFSPDGSRLASASWDVTVRLWDAATGAQQQTLEGHTRSVRTVVFSPDGSRLASASDDKTVRLWDAATGAQQQMLNTEKSIRNFVFSRDGLCLQTDRGTLQILPPSSADIDTFSSPVVMIFVKNQWICQREKNLVWLPVQYRSDAIAVRSDTIAVGQSSGKVLVLEVST